MVPGNQTPTAGKAMSVPKQLPRCIHRETAEETHIPCKFERFGVSEILTQRAILDQLQPRAEDWKVCKTRAASAVTDAALVHEVPWVLRRAHCRTDAHTTGQSHFDGMTVALTFCSFPLFESSAPEWYAGL